MVKSFWKTVRQFLKQLDVELPYNPVPLRGVYSREWKTCSHKNLYMDVYSNIMPKDGNNSNVLQRMTRSTKYSKQWKFMWP